VFRIKNGPMKYEWTMRRIAISAWFLLFVIAVVAGTYPVNCRILRALIVGAVPLLWCGAVVLMWRRKKVALVIFAVGIMIALFVCLPGQKPSVARLCEAYIHNLRYFDGSRYVWGGENSRGIDCSGLVREGMIHANLVIGLRTLNPKPLRAAFEMWWYDCSARALRDAYRGFTTPVFQAGSINAISNQALNVGDIAVTVDGVHVLAYLGRNTWIEADPCVMKVVEIITPSENVWFTVPVQIMRWKQLNESVD
jgi:hypothetical protein